MKVIDLLNKIAKGEKVPKKFKYDDMTYIYNDYLREHFDEKGQDSFNYTFDLTDYDVLNDEIEIIEDTSKEETQVLSRWYPPKEDKKIKRIEERESGWWANMADGNVSTLKQAVDEIIDRLNGE